MNIFSDVKTVLYTLFIFAFAIGTVVFLIIMVFNSFKAEKVRLKFNKKHLGEDSYKRYAKFYGDIVPTDEEYMDKLSSIYKLINTDKITDINLIAKNSNCTLEECVLKIRYLKNKKLIENYYIDTSNFVLLPCSVEDQKLLDKYKPYIYASHLQIDEIANYVANKGYKTINELREDVFNDLVYLNKKGLINGIKIDEIDRRIIYYTIEKRKINDGLETVHCPNCGALNDVSTVGKVRCGYCNTIIKGSNYDGEIEVL